MCDAPLSPHRKPNRQRGAAVLALLLLVFLASTYWMISGNGVISARLDASIETSSALHNAKDALIGRAAMDANHPGSLPCPDSNGDGIAELLAGNNCPVYIGRLPWKTLDLPNLRDASGESLWYALAPAISDGSNTKQINPSKPLELQLDGTANIAAIIISPGPPITGQNGRPSNAKGDYLEGDNANADFNYVSQPLSDVFNDQLLPITREELFRVVNERVLAEIRGPDNNPGGPPLYGIRHFLALSSSLPNADSGSDGLGDAATTGHLPYADLGMAAAATFPPYPWMNLNGWIPLVGYERLSATSARLSIGAAELNVFPCSASPCP